LIAKVDRMFKSLVRMLAYQVQEAQRSNGHLAHLAEQCK